MLRPDNVVVLPNGVWALYEVEQEADLSLLRRVVEGLRRKAVFYRAGGVPGLSSVVRVVFAVARERLEGTLRVWERAVALVAEENGGRLPFQLVAMPLAQFLEGPDWSEPPEPKRWRALQPEGGSRGGRRSGGAEEQRSGGVGERTGRRWRCGGSCRRSCGGGRSADSAGVLAGVAGAGAGTGV